MLILPIILDAHIVVETGLGEGHSTRIFLTALSQLLGERVLHTYDILDTPGHVKTKERIESIGFPAKWQLHVGDVRQTGKEYNFGPIDLLYLDSDHGLEHVAKELELFTPHLSEKAIIFTHDSWPSITEAPHPNATYIALNDWGNKNGWKSLLLKFPEGMTFLVRMK